MKKMRPQSTILSVVILFLWAFSLPAGAVEWTGTVDSNWNLAKNWSSQAVPGATKKEMAVLSGSSDVVVVVTPSARIEP